MKYEFLGKYAPSSINKTLDELGFTKSASAQTWKKATDNLGEEDQTALMKRLNLAAQLHNTMQQTANARALKTTHEKNLTNLIATEYTSRGAQGLFDRLNGMRYAETLTTHPLQIATPREEYLLHAFSKRYNRLLEFDELEQNDSTHAERAKVEKQLSRIVTRLEKLPSQNEKRPNAVAETKLKLPFAKISASGWAQTNTTLKETIFNLTNANFEGTLSRAASWLGMDNDRNKVLQPADSYEAARFKAQDAYRLHAKELGQLIAKTEDASLKSELRTIRHRLINTAHQSGHNFTIVGSGGHKNYSDKGTFKNIDEYEAALRNLRNDARFTGQRFKIEKLVSLAQNVGFHLLEGEARQNAGPLDDVLAALYKSANLETPQQNRKSVKADIARFQHLAENFEEFKKIDLDTLNFSHLEEANASEAKKLIECLKEYKRTRDNFGDKALSRLVIAESRSPTHVLAMRLLCESIGLVTDSKNGLKIIPLVESSADKRFMRTFLEKIDGTIKQGTAAARAINAFKADPEIMQAASDTLRVNGQNYGIRAIHTLAYHLQRVYNNISIYWGMGADPQRTGDRLPHETVEYLFNGVQKFRQTVQGCDYTIAYRAPMQAAAHSLASLSTMLSRAFAEKNGQLYQELDTAVALWARASHNNHKKYVTGSKANVDEILNALTPTRFIGALNAGSRAGVGEQGGDYHDLSVFKKIKYASARAISLAFGGKASGLNATTIGMGHALADQINNDAAALDKLHQAYKEVPGFRLMVDTTVGTVGYANHGAIETNFAHTLQANRATRNWFNYHKADTDILKQYLPKIIHGTNTEMTFEQLNLRMPQRRWFRVTQTLVASNLSKVLSSNTSSLNGPLSKTFRLLRLGMSGIARLTGRYA